MSERSATGRGKGWTRAQVLRSAAGAGAAAAAGSAWLGARAGMEAAASGPSAEMDARILGLFLELEQAQERFYRQALRTARLGGELRDYAATVADQERAHAQLLVRRIGPRAGNGAQGDVGEALRDPVRFRDAAVDLEEAVIAAYIGQGANLTRGAVAAVVPMVSVEARQAAWIRDLAGSNPAPRAADPARTPEDVRAELRRKGLLA